MKKTNEIWIVHQVILPQTFKFEPPFVLETLFDVFEFDTVLLFCHVNAIKLISRENYWVRQLKIPKMQ